MKGFKHPKRLGTYAIECVFAKKKYFTGYKMTR